MLEWVMKIYNTYTHHKNTLESVQILVTGDNFMILDIEGHSNVYALYRTCLFTALYVLHK